MATTDVIGRIKRHWLTNGPAATVLAIAEILFSPLVRRRRRLVFSASLEAPRQPSKWNLEENLLIIGPDNITAVNRTLLASLQVDRHKRDFQGIPNGNRLFVVTNQKEWLHRGYIRMIDGRKDDRKALFFGDLLKLPEIRSCETTESARGRGLYRRVLNEQLRYLQALGYDRAILYVMAENVASIKAVEAAGFKLHRTLHDWIFFNLVIFQRVGEAGFDRRRIFLR
jgi:RimJ/RimL family protein N-acetyltransferase